MKLFQKSGSPGSWLRKNRLSILCLAVAFVLFLAVLLWANSGEKPENALSGDYAEYENGTVLEVLADTCVEDPASDYGVRGEQTLSVLVETGQYQGMTLMASCYASPLYNGPVSPGDSVTLIISTYASGDIAASVYEYNRSGMLGLVVLIFFLVTVLVGGKTGAKSLLGLVLTIVCLLFILLPVLLKGAPTVPATFLICAFVAVVSFILLGGVNRKTLCAMLGTMAGTAIALCFGVLAQAMTRISGLRVPDVEPLLQLRQTGTPIGLKGLLTAGIVIGALGAVMDVAMSISSALWELKTVNPEMTGKELWRSGMNIGRDMVGTMTNTLILAFVGGSFVLILYLYSLELPIHELLSSSYLSIEVISGVASSIGVVLSVPLTALIGCLLYTKQSK